MRRDTQLWFAGTIAVAIAVASVVVINQRAQISDQRESLDQQSEMAAALKERSDEATRLRQQETNFALQLKALDAEQARNAASAAADQASQAATEQRTQERQRLEAQIQDLKVQRERLARQTTCTQIQTGLRAAERSGDEAQTKALQERWNATCTSG
jgi:hypothetical protein